MNIQQEGFCAAQEDRRQSDPDQQSRVCRHPVGHACLETHDRSGEDLSHARCISEVFHRQAHVPVFGPPI